MLDFNIEQFIREEEAKRFKLDSSELSIAINPPNFTSEIPCSSKDAICLMYNKKPYAVIGISEIDSIPTIDQIQGAHRAYKVLTPIKWEDWLIKEAENLISQSYIRATSGVWQFDPETQNEDVLDRLRRRYDFNLIENGFKEYNHLFFQKER